MCRTASSARQFCWLPEAYCFHRCPSLIFSFHWIGKCPTCPTYVFFPPLQDSVQGKFGPTLARPELAVWVDEYFLAFPEMPAAIAGLGIHGIESTNGKLIKERAAEAEKQRLEVAKAAKAAEELELSQRLLLDKMAEARALKAERDMLKAGKQQLIKQQKAQDYDRYQDGKNVAAQEALTAGLQACKKRYGFKAQTSQTSDLLESGDHFDQGFFTCTQPLSDWARGVKSGPERVLLPSAAVIVLSLLSMVLDTSKPFKFKPNEWTWLDEAMIKVQAVIALRIRAEHLCAMMTVLSALDYFVDSVPYVIGETIYADDANAPPTLSLPPTVLVTGYIITAAKSKKKLDEVVQNADGHVWQEGGFCLHKEIFAAPNNSNPHAVPSPLGTFDAYTFRPDSGSGVFGKAGSGAPEFLVLAHYLRHRYTHNIMSCKLFVRFLFAFCYLFFITDRGIGGKEKKLHGKPEPAVFATEDGGHEAVKASAVLSLGVVVFPAIVPATASPSGFAVSSASETRWLLLFLFFSSSSSKI